MVKEGLIILIDQAATSIEVLFVLKILQIYSGMNLGVDGINVIPTTFPTSFPTQIPK